MAAVAAHELHAGSRQPNVEHARVRCVRQVKAHNLFPTCGERKLGLAVHQSEVAEPAHRGVARLGAAERGDPSVRQQDVVKRERDLAVDRRPVVRIRRGHEDGAVQAHLLVVVLADVRVVPVDAGVGELQAVREGTPDRDRLLGPRRPVAAILEPEPVPMHRVLGVALVHHVYDELRALDPQDGSRDGAVVGEHARRRLAELLRHRGDAEVERVAVGELDHLRGTRLGQVLGRGGEWSGEAVMTPHRS